VAWLCNRLRKSSPGMDRPLQASINGNAIARRFQTLPARDRSDEATPRESGDSTGDFASARFADLVSDARAAFAYLETRQDVVTGHIGVLGHSEGSANPIQGVPVPDQRDSAA
jgi:hypothetical protein